MKRFSTRTLWVLGLLAALAFGMMWHISPEWSRQGGLVTLTGNTPGVLGDARFIQHSNPAKTIEVVIGLKVKNEKALQDLLARQRDPNSPDFKKFLTPDEFAARFSPSDAEVKRVIAHMRRAGLTVVEVTPNRLLVRVRGTVKQVEKAFSLQINEYALDGFGTDTTFSNDRDPSIPVDLQDVVGSISGLNNIAVLQSHYVRSTNTKHHGGVPSGYGPGQVATAYNYPNDNSAHAKTKYTGKGVTVAIATAYTYDLADVQEYWKQYGVNRTGTVTNVNVNGTPAQLDGETTLDLQQVSSQAPGADVIMYQGADPGFTTFALVFNQIVTDNKASVATVSWGLCEKGTGAAEMKTEHLLFEQAAAQGISFFAAAGDDGAYDCPGKSKAYTVDYPSSDPYVTAVGGTALLLNADNSRKSEAAWTGAGGGISNTYEQPSWQNAFAPKNNKRNTSDVSLVADPATGYSIYFEGAWDQAGGTSFASPEWAGLTALAVEANGGERLGQISPAVTRIGNSPDYSKVFYDVTKGDNGNGKGPGYPATLGWDHPTGWGTPDGTRFVDWMKNDKGTATATPAPTGNPNPAPTPKPTPPAPTKHEATAPQPSFRSNMAPLMPQR